MSWLACAYYAAKIVCLQPSYFNELPFEPTVETVITALNQAWPADSSHGPWWPGTERELKDKPRLLIGRWDDPRWQSSNSRQRP
jgi:hypothetical protein